MCDSRDGHESCLRASIPEAGTSCALSAPVLAVPTRGAADDRKRVLPLDREEAVGIGVGNAMK